MMKTAMDLLLEIIDLVDGLVFDDLGSEQARPLHALLLSSRQTMEDFTDRSAQLEAVLDELGAVNGEKAAPLVRLLRGLQDLQLWVGRAGTLRDVWLIGTAPDGGRVGVRTSVVWT